MADKNKNNYLWIGIAVVVVIILAIVFISNSKENISEGDALNEITLTQDNFAFVEYSYLNGQGSDQSFCEKRKNNEACGINYGDYTPDMPCPETDIFDLSYRQIGIEDYKWDVYCKVYDGTEIVKVKETDLDGKVTYKEVHQLAGPESAGGIADMTLFLDYMKSHDLLVCCQIDDSQIADSKMTIIDSQTGKQSTVNAGEKYGTLSNEVCLPKVKVEPVC